MEQKYCFFFASKKGGVGKTFLAMSLVEFLRREPNSRDVMVVDADHKNRSMRQRYAQRNSEGEILANENQNMKHGVLSLERSMKDNVELLGWAIDTGLPYVVVDFAAAAEYEFESIFPSKEAMESSFNAAGYKLIVVLPFDEQTESTSAAQDIFNVFGDVATYVLIKNPKNEDSIAELNRRFQEIKPSLKGSALLVDGVTMHKDALSIFSEYDTYSFEKLERVTSKKDRFLSKIKADRVRSFVQEQNLMWCNVFRALEKIHDTNLETTNLPAEEVK